MSKQFTPVIVQPGMRTDLHAFGNVLSVMLSGEQTGNTISIMLETTPPGGGPPLHVHSREEEIFIVAEGWISYCVKGRWIEVGPGALIYPSLPSFSKTVIKLINVVQIKKPFIGILSWTRSCGMS